ncbi:MAG: sulfatase [Planctomycetota bacterium]|nr:sulfatase [Planctomycetota bacterium]
MAFAFSACHAAEPAKPNFVIIFVDDMGYGDVGCFGGTIQSPRLDEMATEGMRFTSFYGQQVCGPSRSAILTGCYPMRVAEKGNIKNIHPVLHDKEVTIAEVLKDRGYATGCFGKWDQAGHTQVGFDPKLMPNHQGFDYYYGTPSSNDGKIDLYRNAKLIEENSDMSLVTKRYTDEVIGFIEKHKDEPFFIYNPHTMPHTRLGASADFRGKSPRGLYGDVINEIDYSVGRVLDTIERLGLAKNTYVIFTSDNGPWLIHNKNKADGTGPKDHGGSAGVLRSGKVSTWEGGIRVPTIVWAPDRVAPGTTCATIASTMDLLPTLAALSGGKAPTDRKLDGEDIRHLLEGAFDQATKEKTFFGYQTTELQSVRQGSWKLHLARAKQREWNPFANNAHIAEVDNFASETPALYNLDDDIGESKDIAAAHSDVVAQLLRLAESARADLGDYNRIGSGQRFFDPGPKRKTEAQWIN